MAGRSKLSRAVELARVARRARLVAVLREIGVMRRRPATREGAIRFREALEELGTSFVKLGQLLSSRPDLLPDVYVEELEKLVDEVPEVPFEPLRGLIAREVGLEAFASIDERPLATASIAQIHPALLVDGREVVVKVRRPGVDEQVALDLDLLRQAARVAERRSGAARLLQLDALADELEQHLRAELDFREEAHNAELIARVLEPFRADIAVPGIVRPYVTASVLVQEQLDGVKLADAALEPRRAAELARVLFRAYIHQVTVAGVYHADPHSGNVLLLSDARLGLVDFGLIGRLDENTRTSLTLLLFAIAENRADDVADLIMSLSLTSAASDAPGFLLDLRRTLPRYHHRPLESIRTGEGLAALQRLCLRHGIALPTTFALVGKTLSQAESIARELDPGLDPVEIIRHEGWNVVGTEVARRLRPRELSSLAFTQLEPLLRLPRRVAHLVQTLDAGALKIGIAPVGLDDFEHLVRSIANRLGAAVIVSALLIASALIASVSHAVALAGFCVACVFALVMLWRIARTPGGL